jgi:hypothetical protein
MSSFVRARPLLALLLAIVLCLPFAAFGAQPLHVAMDDMEPLPMLSSWANAQTTYGAKGDGVTDDTAALQNALNDLGASGKASVLYLPPGRYRIASTLNLNAIPAVGGHGSVGLSIIGDAPSTTSIVWAGPSGAPMILQNGGFNMSYSRLTLNGSGTAGYGVAMWWSFKTSPINESSPEFLDMVFQDMSTGIMAGELKSTIGPSSEGQIRRVTFLRMGLAGVDLGNWNSVSWWIWDSQFIDCHIGVTNLYSVNDTGPTPGAGGFYIYRSLFLRSKEADAEIANTVWLSMYHNVSISSNRFWFARAIGGGAGTILVGNRILDTVQADAIHNNNLGPLILIDNQVRSAPGVTAPAVLLDAYYGQGSIVAINNQYTVANPYVLNPYEPAVASSDRLMSIGDTTVAYSSISSTQPTMPGTPARPGRQVFEVASGSNAARIQAVINQATAAAAAGAVNPIVHLPPGTYNIATSLVIPANARLQIVGDAWTTLLVWQGANGGSIFTLQGPSLATVRNMYFLGGRPSATAVAITKADQPGGRILIQGSDTGALNATSLPQTQITAQQSTVIESVTLNGAPNFLTMSVQVGPFAATNGVNALIADSWVEGPATSLYRMDNGDFTYIGGFMAPGSDSTPVAPIVPAVYLNNFSGHALFAAPIFANNFVPGVPAFETGLENGNTNILLLGAEAYLDNYFLRTSSGGNVGIVASTQPDPTIFAAEIPNQGNTSTAFVSLMFSQLRSLVWESAPYVAPAGSTNVRLYRLGMADTQGVAISGQ